MRLRHRHFSYICPTKYLRTMKHAFRLGAVVLLWTAAACGPKSPAPEFTLLAMDTTLVCGPVGYDVQYRFTSIANASHSPALQAIEEANIQYFFGLEDFTGTASEAIAAASIASVGRYGTICGPTKAGPFRRTLPYGNTANRPNRRPRSSTRCSSIRSAPRVTRAAPTACMRPWRTTTRLRADTN